MKERGMIFNSEMVRAILDGRKTQTRRIMKVQPESNQLGLLLITDSTKHSDIGKYHWAESNATGNHVRSKLSHPRSAPSANVSGCVKHGRPRAMKTAVMSIGKIIFAKEMSAQRQGFTAPAASRDR